MKRNSKRDTKCRKLIKCILREDTATADKIVKSMVNANVQARMDKYLDTPVSKFLDVSKTKNEKNTK